MTTHSTCINCEPFEALVLESEAIAEDIYAEGVTDGYNGIVPQQSTEIYLMGYVAGARDRAIDDLKKVEHSLSDLGSCGYYDDF